MKTNIAELLRDCPTGMELDCTMYDNIVFDSVSNCVYPIKVITKDGNKSLNLTKYGCTSENKNAKCVIFPKGKTTWEGFVPPYQFKDGDILTYTSNHTTTFIYRNKDNEPNFSTSFYVACNNAPSNNFLIYNKSTLIALNENCEVRLATEEEKQKLFDAIKANGYHWNTNTKTLEKFPKFKVGDMIKKKGLDNVYAIKITSVTPKIYTFRDGSFQYVKIIDKDYELAPNKFNITTLKPFDKVLVRNTNTEYWRISLFGAIVHDDRRYFMCLANSGFYQCIPYEGNQHLLGTTNDCDNFYKTWEK